MSEIGKRGKEIGDEDHCKATEQFPTCAPRLTIRSISGTTTMRQVGKVYFKVVFAQMDSRLQHLFQSSPVLERHLEYALSKLLGKLVPRACFAQAISSPMVARRLLMLMTRMIENCNRSIGRLHMARFRWSELSVISRRWVPEGSMALEAGNLSSC